MVSAVEEEEVDDQNR